MLERYFWQWPIPADMRPHAVFGLVALIFGVNLLARFVPAWLFLLVLGGITVPLLVSPTLTRAKKCLAGCVACLAYLALFNLARHTASDYLLLRSSVSSWNIMLVGFAYSLLAAAMLSGLGWLLRSRGAL